MGKELSETERAILDFARRTYGASGAKERDIRKELGLSSNSYHVKLQSLVHSPAALAYAPEVIRRLEAVLQENP